MEHTQINLFIFFILLYLNLFPAQQYAQGSGNSLYFDGINDYVEITDGNELNLASTLTLEAWIKPTLGALANKPFIICRYNPELDEVYKLGFNNTNAIEVRLNGPELIFITENNVVQEDIWSHIAMTFNGSIVSVYVNGILIAQENFSQNLFSTIPGKLLIGVDDDTFAGLSFNQHFEGFIDEIRIWDVALTQNQLRTNMCQKLSGIENRLVGYWNFDQSTGELIDLINSNNGSLIGGLDYSYSGAPIGNLSTFYYPENWNDLDVSFTFGANDFIRVDNISEFNQGLHFYKVQELPNVTTGISQAPTTGFYYGVFCTELDATYSLEYAIGNIYPDCYNCEERVQLYSRNDNAVLNWTDLDANLIVDACSFEKNIESEVGYSKRAEYIPGKIQETFVLDLGPDQILCNNEALIIDLELPQGSNISWQDGSTDNEYTISQDGLYIVEIINSDCYHTDSILIESENFSLGSDIFTCNFTENIFLNAALQGADYIWQDGSNDSLFIATEPGQYTVIVSTSTCEFYDTINISDSNSFDFNLGEDQIVCGEEQIFIGQDFSFGTILWNDNNTNSIREVTESGMYIATISIEDECSFMDSLIVDFVNRPIVDLGNDTTICSEEEFELTAFYSNADYEWQNNTTEPVLNISAEGLYSVTVSSSNDCFATDSINILIEDCKICNLFVPNAFTPNDDGVNDSFTSFSNCEFSFYNLKIFTRWGEFIFESNNPSNPWDGKFKGKNVENNILVYLIEYSFNEGTIQSPRIKSGDFLLLK